MPIGRSNSIPEFDPGLPHPVTRQVRSSARLNGVPGDIMLAARELYETEGVAATSMAAIARKAGITRTLLYYYFPNKQAVTDAVLDDYIEDLVESVSTWNELRAFGNTPAELVEWTKNLSIEIGKTPVVVNEAPGFVVNKILIPYCNEGVCVLQEGVASAEDIDIAMQLGCNHPMGPLHLGDLIGWDVVLNIMDVLFNETHDSKYRANVMIRKMVRAGKLGMKSGEGIFNYKK